jgi:hypothetical protein
MSGGDRACCWPRDAAVTYPLSQCSGDQTTRTSAFDVIRPPASPDDFDGRALRNSILEQWEYDDSLATAIAVSDDSDNDEARSP